ncbi:hypothetical protein [Kallotenue papyrolyticum]|uniref:hypothetical protein n=1 Tax=Kallotenue papyrolyticum TaxID=1325125 RepID=UPI0004785F0A|nr:hypothetical protein [Kallotenue papyrolyticum]
MQAPRDQHHRSPSTPDSDVVVRLHSVARQLRRRRRLRLSLRAAWLALAVWSLQPFAGVLGRTLPPAPVLGLALLTLAVGLLYAWLSHPSLARLAKGLDRAYRLDEQLATALEVAQRQPATPIEGRLLHETAMLVQRMRAYIARQPLLPWREIETGLAITLLTLGLTLANRPALPTTIPPMALPDLPPPEAPSATAQPQPSDQPAAVTPTPPPLSPQGRAAAEALADGLRDSGATRAAAEALDRGDTAGAARELRELADQAGELSETARRDIAEGLRQAAEQLRETQPELAERLERQAQGLESDAQAAGQALDDLARTVEELNQPGQPAADAAPTPAPAGGQPSGDQLSGQAPGNQAGGPGAGNQLGGEQRGAQSGGVQPEGAPLPLPEPPTTDGPTAPAAGPRGPTIELQGGGTGAAPSGSNPADTPLGGAPDPLAIPPEYRDVVEDYFSP